MVSSAHRKQIPLEQLDVSCWRERSKYSRFPRHPTNSMYFFVFRLLLRVVKIRTMHVSGMERSERSVRRLVQRVAASVSSWELR